MQRVKYLLYLMWCGKVWGKSDKGLKLELEIELGYEMRSFLRTVIEQKRSQYLQKRCVEDRHG